MSRTFVRARALLVASLTALVLTALAIAPVLADGGGPPFPH
jgi:hypothetical protein